VVKQKGMVFGLRKTATAVTRPERKIDLIFSKFFSISDYGSFRRTSIRMI
jgi:hypothetical protein